MTLSERQCDFTFALGRLILRAFEMGLKIRLDEAYRTPQTQEEYVEKGVSRTMDSRHIDKMAADIVIFKDGVAVWEGEEYRRLGEFWEGLGGRWGGRFGLEHLPEDVRKARVGWDPGHFEFRRIP